jgi:hypothetical protein
MTYLQIKDGFVKNAIVLNDESLIPIFSEGFDFFIRSDEMIPQPGIGWSYDGAVFAEPVAQDAEI